MAIQQDDSDDKKPVRYATGEALDELKERLKTTDSDRRFWRVISLGCAFLTTLLGAQVASTIIDGPTSFPYKIFQHYHPETRVIEEVPTYRIPNNPQEYMPAPQFMVPPTPTTPVPRLKTKNDFVVDDKPQRENITI